MVNRNQNDFYLKYCTFFSQFTILRKLGNLIHSKRLFQISNYLKEEYKLLPNEIVATSIATFILFLVPLIILFYRTNPILGIAIPFVLSYFAAYKVFSYPITKYDRIQHMLLQYSDLAFQDLLLILNTTDSIFDAIEFLSKAGYPVLSEKFKEIIFHINRYGASPETLLRQFVETLPNSNLKERLVNLIATKFYSHKILEQLEFLAGDKKFEYATATSQLESKLIILLGLYIFIPILTALFVSFSGGMANYLSFLMVPLFILLTSKSKTHLLKTDFELFGESSLLKKEELGTNTSDLIEFLDILTYFGNQLKQGNPQEIALLEAYRSYKGPLKLPIQDCLKKIYLQNKSFKMSWYELKKSLKDSQIHFLISLIDRMLDKSSIETGNRILSILQQLKANRELIRERESIIKAQQFKVKFLSFVLAAILGLLAGIAPLLVKMGNLVSNPGGSVVFNFWDTFPLSLSLLFMILYTSYFITKIVKTRHPWQFSIWAGLIFIILWYLSSLLISQ